MKIVSWNVNGVRACVKKGAYHDYLKTSEPDILFLQETKANVDQLTDEITQPYMYQTEWVSAEQKGYSGVALITKTKPLDIIKQIGIKEFDDEGRVIGALYQDKVIFGVYFPNSQREGRLDYKFRFKEAFFKFCDEFRQDGKDVVVSGDFNTAHHSIDLARPKENVGSAGFLPEERAWMDKIINDYGYVDTFRHFNTSPNNYTWWTYRAGARQRNIGWRIDYVMVSKGLLPKVSRAFIEPTIMGSDHCPVGIIIE